MTEDDIIRMAGEARLAFDSEEFPEIWQVYLSVGREEIKHFAALVAAHEREACADVCDQHATCEGIAQECAAAIRERGESK